MKIIETSIPEVKIFEPRVFGDHRGYFMETFRQDIFEEAVGSKVNFVQDNESLSSYGVLRGLHAQKGAAAQGKLVRVIEGEVLDVAVDIRPESPTYKQYVSCRLSADNKRQMWVPRGFAHGFVVLSPQALFAYKCDNYYRPDQELGIQYNDPELNIDWIVDAKDMQLSEKDIHHPTLKDIG